MALSDSLPQINLGVQGETQGGLHSGAQRINPEFRVGSNFESSLSSIFQGWRTRVVEDKVTDYVHLNQALIEQIPVVRNRSELETRFYASSQKNNQKPSDFVYQLLKIHKILKLEITEEKLLDHVISRSEPQILDYGEKIRGSSWEFQDTNQSENNRLPKRNWQENWRETRGNNRYSDNSRPRREFNRFEGQGVADNRRFDGRRRRGQSDHRFHNQGGRQGGSSPKDIEKTAFITRNSTFAFLRMPFGLSGAATNFQKAIDIILKPVIGRFVMVYMDDVIITSPSFNEHIDNLNQEHRPCVQNAVSDVLSRNPLGNMDGSQISCVALRALALNSRDQLIREQREDPELGHIYRYLENPDDCSVNATVCEGWSQNFKLIDGLLFYTKYSTTLGELRVYIPKSLREAIIQEFHDLLLAGHLGKKEDLFKIA
ncbi:uncharacterized protein TNCV_3523921 [Trichonephila clavipes]|uniref:Reverse transcriptase domain-containing protein n=1 Tax=Trichonephila clavipes TaxID=2585209 RepID=A0A8X6S4V2_TRICX|nr:uncharacterized protein TNCV_3523921 [Trichonephila clavipes]